MHYSTGKVSRDCFRAYASGLQNSPVDWSRILTARKWCRMIFLQGNKIYVRMNDTNPIRHFKKLKLSGWPEYDLKNTYVISNDVPPRKQGKSEGFESCDRPIVRKCPIWLKISDVLSRVTLKFDGWPWKTIGHLSFVVSSSVQHFIAIGEFKLKLQSGNAQFGSNWTIFRAVWPWNLMDDLGKQ